MSSSAYYEVFADKSSVIEDLTVVIQAGGESRRMGRSKATVPFLGRPLIWRTIHRLTPIAGEMIITTNEPEKLGFLAEEYGRGDIRLVPDIINQRGALNGLYTALYAASKPYVAVVACDMVFASAPLLTYEYERIREFGCDAAIPNLSHGYEPFHSVYKKDPCIGFVKEALDAGEVRANCWYDKAKLYLLDSGEVLAADPRGASFINVNTPEELKAVEERIKNDEMTSAADDL